MTYPNGVYTEYKYYPDNYRLLGISQKNKKGMIIVQYDYDEMWHKV